MNLNENTRYATKTVGQIYSLKPVASVFILKKLGNGKPKKWAEEIKININVYWLISLQHLSFNKIFNLILKVTNVKPKITSKPTMFWKKKSIILCILKSNNSIIGNLCYRN